MVPEFDEWSFALQDRWLAYVRFGLSKHQASTITLETYAMGMSHWHKFLKDHHPPNQVQYLRCQSRLK